ncbi:MAG TPA: GDP-L-fucose synthase [Steroidobacteraceae bacterium]|nr:GDP-L-fucose synthase [Steroidobacteraceae bacterium]
MNPDASIFVAGHCGLVGAALVRRLRSAGFANLILRERRQLDLRCQQAVEQFFAEARPQYLFLAAARVGGILANDTRPAEFLRDNLAIQTNVIHAAHVSGVRKLLFLGSSCMYPKHAPQPMAEECLLTGPLEPTNEAYAVAKIAGLKMCQAYRRQFGLNAIAAMPTNLYGPGDNFSLQDSHVLPALLRRFHEARESGAAELSIWGTGRPRREFLHVDDLADACLFMMQQYTAAEPLNVGWGKDTTIQELAETIARIVGFEGAIRFDSSRPDGAPRKLLDTSRLAALGWAPRISLEAGIRSTYAWFCSNLAQLRT